MILKISLIFLLHKFQDFQQMYILNLHFDGHKFLIHVCGCHVIHGLGIVKEASIRL